MDPWLLEIIVVRDGSHGGGDRRSLSKVERSAFEAMSPEARHVVRLRAFAAVSSTPPVFGFWSAGVVCGLPVLRSRLEQGHTVVDQRRGRGQEGVSAHLFRLTDGEVDRVGDLLVTGVPRTVVDIAGASPFDEGVMAADAALRSGVLRARLEEAIAAAGSRRAGARIEDVVAFAHPGAESAAENPGAACGCWRPASHRRSCSTGSPSPPVQRPSSTSSSRTSGPVARPTAT